jgi:hypothetical protein
MYKSKICDTNQTNAVSFHSNGQTSYEEECFKLLILEILTIFSECELSEKSKGVKIRDPPLPSLPLPLLCRFNPTDGSDVQSARGVDAYSRGVQPPDPPPRQLANWIFLDDTFKKLDRLTS